MTDPQQPDSPNGHGSSEPSEEQFEVSGDQTNSQFMSSMDSSQREFMEKVLKQTLSTEPGTDFFPIIVRFVERNQQRKVTEPEVAEALVDEVLQHRLGKVTLPAECSGWIAKSILDDPDSRDRLKRLWATALAEANGH